MSEMKVTRPWRKITSIVLLVVVGGCVDQKKELSTYRNLIDNNQPAPVQVAPDKVLTLEDALMLANQNEEQLSLQGENYLQALIAKDRAFAAFLPTVNLTPNWVYTNAGGNGTSQVLGGSVSGSWNLFNGFRDYDTLKADTATIEQQKQLIFDLQQTVLLDVATTYYQVLTSEQSVDVLSNSLQVQEENVRTLVEQKNVGAARPLDVAQAEAQASQTRVSLLQAQADVRNGRAELAFLVDAPIKENPLSDDFAPPAEVASLDSWIAAAEAGRQDLLAASQEVRATRYEVEVAIGEYYPSINLSPNYFFYSLGSQAGTLWTLGLNLTQPLFTGGAIYADVRHAWSVFRVAALIESQLRRNIDSTVEQSYVNLDLARSELNELEVQVRAARDEFYLAQQLYKNGGGTYLNVLQAQSTLLSTQLQLTTELFAQKTAYFNLLRSAGKLSFAAMQSATRPSQQEVRRLATQPVTRPSTMPGFYRY
jgi:outer membrane protein TolC